MGQAIEIVWCWWANRVGQSVLSAGMSAPAWLAAGRLVSGLSRSVASGGESALPFSLHGLFRQVQNLHLCRNAFGAGAGYGCACVAGGGLSV